MIIKYFALKTTFFLFFKNLIIFKIPLFSETDFLIFKLEILEKFTL